MSVFIFQHDLTSLKFNLYKIGQYELCIQPRLFDYCIAISTSQSKKEGEFIFTHPIPDNSIQRTYSAFFHLLSNNQGMNYFDLLNKLNFELKELLDPYYYPTYPLVQILEVPELTEISKSGANPKLPFSN